MPLTSRTEQFRVKPSAPHWRACSGNGDFLREYARSCTRQVAPSEEHVERMAVLPTGRAVPRVLYVASWHCAHCALAFFPAVNVGEANG
jgi:hypothetical protein